MITSHRRTNWSSAAVTLLAVSCAGCSDSRVVQAPTASHRGQHELVDQINDYLRKGDLAGAQALDSQLLTLQETTNLHEIATSPELTVKGPVSDLDPIVSPEKQHELQQEFDDATGALHELFLHTFSQAQSGMITRDEFANAALSAALTQKSLNVKTEEYNRDHPHRRISIDARHEWYSYVDDIIEQIIPRQGGYPSTR